MDQKKVIGNELASEYIYATTKCCEPEYLGSKMGACLSEGVTELFGEKYDHREGIY